MVYAVIYKATNLLNGKIYIGQTINLKQRIVDHATAGFGYPFARAVKEFGKNNFIYEHLYNCTDDEDANRQEEFHIEKHKACDPSIGYNVRNKVFCNRSRPWVRSKLREYKLFLKKDLLETLRNEARSKCLSLHQEIENRLYASYGVKK